MIIEMKCYFMFYLHYYYKNTSKTLCVFFQIQVTELLWKASTCWRWKSQNFFSFNVIKLHEDLSVHKNNQNILHLVCPTFPVPFLIWSNTRKSSKFGFKMHSEKKVIKIKTECCCSHGLLLKRKLRHYYWNVILAV